MSTMMLFTRWLSAVHDPVTKEYHGCALLMHLSQGQAGCRSSRIGGNVGIAVAGPTGEAGDMS
jgi:hypothetical protein